MSTEIQHIEHARHNIKFLENFYNDFSFNDWAVTVSFYIAVHIVEAAISKTKNIKIGTQTLSIQNSEELLKFKSLFPGTNLSYHEARNIIVNQNFLPIANLLKPLYNDSRTARYINYGVDKLKVELLIKNCLREIINWYNKAYSASLKINLS